MIVIGVMALVLGEQLAGIDAAVGEVEDEQESGVTTTVTATRTPRPLRDVPATTIIMPRLEIERSPSLMIDDVLRTIPSVSTFRRSSSLVADPTSQGLNLRGIGPSAVSRSLVLVDGIPVNDPFGGWVYWQSIPRLGIERIEVVPGGGSALYGSSALGGVVELVPRELDEQSFDADLLTGTWGTGIAALRGVERWGDVGAGIDAELVSSSGYRVVAPWDRGAIDGSAGSVHGSGVAGAEWQPSDGLRIKVRGGGFQEEQHGGTAFTTAGVRLAHLAGGVDLRGDAGHLDVRLFGRLQELNQTRARVDDARATEERAAVQRVPADDVGVSLVWAAPQVRFLGVHDLSAGVDVRQVRGVSHEEAFPPGAATSIRRASGGMQRHAGAFLQDLLHLVPGVDVSGAVRFDGWMNLEGERRVVRGDEENLATFPDRIDGNVSPRLGVLFRPVDGVAVRTSAYHAFRAPTLNELYRPFQVGTIATAANENLRPERLWGGEAGTEVRVGPGAHVRATGFWNLLDEPIANVTLSEEEAAARPDGAVRQRQNLGSASVRGLELSADARVARGVSAVLGWTIVDARVTSAPAAPALVGKQLPQDPMHRATATVTFHDERLFTLTSQVRVLGAQFEDDMNTLSMPGVALVDFSLRRRLFWNLSLVVAAENVFNQQYIVGRAGVDTIGSPFFARVGVELRS